MKVCVVVPSEEHLATAGVRIRYQRLQKPLESLGLQIRIRLIDQFHEKSAFQDDVYLIPEGDDARGILLAKELARRGARVGVDLFDDYFSQSRDSRFVNRRQWLRQISQHSHFFLCSTERMRAVAEEFQPGIAAHVLNDPAEIPEWDPIAQLLHRNLESAVERREISVAWFGIGDNAHFPVGLSDLCAFSHVFAGWEQEGFRVRLKILTNRRALTVSGLEKLQRLPVPWSVEEWSVGREKQVLGESLVAFLPVNGQAFSRAKSLNRALSALCAGTQVLSVGLPLYQNLDAFVYRSPSDFVRDLGNQQLKLCAQTLPQLQELLQDWGNPLVEAQRLHAFLQEVRVHAPQRSSQTDRSPRISAVLHGIQSPVAAHKFAPKVEALSIGTPWSAASLNYDVRLVAGSHDARVLLQLEPRAIAHLDKASRAKTVSGTSATGRAVQVLEVPLDRDPAVQAFGRLSRLKTKAERLDAYSQYFTYAQQILKGYFPGIEFVLSENASPYFFGTSENQGQTFERLEVL